MDDLSVVAVEVMKRSEQAMRRAIREVPDGVYKSVGIMDGFDEPLTIAFNPDLLSAGVEACQSESVTLSSINDKRPVILRGAGVDDYLYLLMPVRVP